MITALVTTIERRIVKTVERITVDETLIESDPPLEQAELVREILDMGDWETRNLVCEEVLDCEVVDDRVEVEDVYDEENAVG